ncbi:MAG TPA: hypothetical protein VNN21_07435 [Dehalococcoidia bacterium]|nr:hypothetical protein [Dehalococcoidia bacterium]
MNDHSAPATLALCTLTRPPKGFKLETGIEDERHPPHDSRSEAETEI